MSQEYDALALRPCPFCGGEGHAYKDNYGKVMVKCEECGAMLGVELELNVPLWDGWRAAFETAGAAVAAWNSRNWLRKVEEDDLQ